jgi:hypothetical protein
MELLNSLYAGFLFHSAAQAQSAGASLQNYPATACKAAFTRRPETVFAEGGSSVTLIALRRNQERKRSRN